MQLLAAKSRSVAECPSLLRPLQETLFEKPVQRGHHGGIREVLARVFDQFTDGGVASHPQCFEHALLERAQLSRSSSKWMENPFHPLAPAVDVCQKGSPWDASVSFPSVAG